MANSSSVQIMSSQSSSSWNKKKTPRQRPGLACEGCRRRKLRCDGDQPACGACSDANLECVPGDAVASPRGPKKGYMKALQARLLKLEQQLLEQQQNDSRLIVAPMIQASDFEEVTMSEPVLNLLPLAMLPTPDNMSPNNNTITSYFPEALSQACVLSDLQHADLDQVYFERAHPFVPILHQRHYFSWSRLATKTESQCCLQYAMWTLAASLSTQMQHVHAALYDTTRCILERLEANDIHFTKTDFNDLEHVQARVLLCLYDFSQTSTQRGWMSSGHCFRLLQLMRLSEIDLPENVEKRKNDPDAESWIRTEEKRRTFWIAYSLDRFISLHNEWPLMLNENTICTRLPSSEHDFRAGHGIPTGFLSELMIAIDHDRHSSFTEVIIWATICGRATIHQQQSRVDNQYGNTPEHFWDRHQWLDEILKTRAEILLAVYPSAYHDADCMVLFANMILHTTVLCLCKAMESMDWQTDQYENACAAFKRRSLLAAREIVNLSRPLASMSYFKVHPFTSVALILCVEFFNAHRYLEESVDSLVQDLCNVLKDMGRVNNLAQTYFMS